MPDVDITPAPLDGMCDTCHRHPATHLHPHNPEYGLCQFCLGQLVAGVFNARRQMNAGAGGPMREAAATAPGANPTTDMTGMWVMPDAGGAEGAPPETPHLDMFCTDLTARAEAGELDPVIGRDDETDAVIEILMRRVKHNPVLTGDPGVGKTAIVEGLAQRIVTGDVPDSLAERRILALDVSGLIAGTAFRGAFEERMQAIVAELVATEGRVILFCDELHALIGAGASQGGVSAANMLKPALSRGEVRLIGATTRDEYRRHIESDPAFARRMVGVDVREPDQAIAEDMLRGIAAHFERFHSGIQLRPDAIEAAVRLSDRYLPDRQLPDKAIDLIDQALARTRFLAERADVPAFIERIDEAILAAVRAGDAEGALALERQRRGEDVGAVRAIGASEVAAVVERLTGVPVAELASDEATRLLGIEARVIERVVGQDDPIATIAQAVRRGRAGLAGGRRPVSVLALGPTGVGKTETARTFAEFIYRDPRSLFIVDCTEYQQPHAISRLIGAPPSYVGYDDGGSLVEQLRRRPHSLVLFDEIEKASPALFDVLLQLLDEGRITDGKGASADARHAVIMMTSNVGAGEVRSVGFSPDATPANDTRRLLEAAKRKWRPEFLNRIDEVVCFAPLSDASARRVVELAVAPLVASVAERGYTLTVTPEVYGHLAAEGLSPEYGARALRRVVARVLETPLSEAVLAAPPEGAVFQATIAEGAVAVRTIAPSTVAVPALPGETTEA